MLHPSDRRHLFESLRPPLGYTLDCAIGTTYTLDLLTLLTAPVAFTSFDLLYEDQKPTIHPQALLATLQQYAERITIFCQAGMIAPLSTDSPLLLSYLENSIVQANPPRGIFHPKIWVLRFVAPKLPILYRCLCLSRNLTFDQSWDTVLILDGQLQTRTIAENAPLSNFIRHLPFLAIHSPLCDRIQTQVDQIQSELNCVEFEKPPGFEQIRFHPLGLANSTFPLTSPIDRLLMISPFVGDRGLNQLSAFGQNNILISRPEELDKLSGQSRDRFAQIYQMNPAANVQEASEETELAPLSGLHAKLYVADSGKKARIWTGSANATHAAFNGNVELLIELVGDRKTFGIDALLESHQAQESFQALLENYIPPAIPEAIDLEQEELQSQARQLQRQLCQMRWIGEVDSLEKPDEYSLSIRPLEDQPFQVDPEFVVRCAPITRRELATEIQPNEKSIATFAPMSCQALTPFIGFEVVAKQKPEQPLANFVLQVPLQNDPLHRRQQILKSILQDKTKVLQFILFLLSESKSDLRDLLLTLSEEITVTNYSETPVATTLKPILPLFEELVRALVRNPAKFTTIARIIQDLQQAAPDERLLDEEFEQIWEPIHLTYQKLKL